MSPLRLMSEMFNFITHKNFIMNHFFTGHHVDVRHRCMYQESKKSTKHSQKTHSNCLIRIYTHIKLIGKQELFFSLTLDLISLQQLSLFKKIRSFGRWPASQLIYPSTIHLKQFKIFIILSLSISLLCLCWAKFCSFFLMI